MWTPESKILGEIWTPEEGEIWTLKKGEIWANTHSKAREMKDRRADDDVVIKNSAKVLTES